MSSVTTTSTCSRPLWTPKRKPTISGEIVECRAHVLMTVRSPCLRRCTFFINLGSIYGPFLSDRDIIIRKYRLIFRLLALFHLAPLQNQRVRVFACSARLYAQGWLTPLRLRMLQTDRLRPFSTTMRMVYGVHCLPSHHRTSSQAAFTTSRTNALQPPIRVTSLADCGIRFLENQ